MDYIIYSIASFCIIFAIGFPIALVVLPSRLTKCALVIAPIFGYCLITFFGYYLYRLGVGFTDNYAKYAFILYLFIGILAVFSKLVFYKKRFSFLPDYETLTGFLFICISWVSVSTLWFFFGSPFISMAISNMDIAELSIVSRFLQEFSRDSVEGVMGQTGWFRLEADEIWFGPSYIVAFISSLINSEPYKLQSIVNNILGAQGAGIAYLLISSLKGVHRRIAIPLGLIYSISPVVIYTSWQSFGAQTVAIPIILSIFWIFFITVREKQTIYGNILGISSLVILFSGLFVTYHFMVLIVIGLMLSYTLSLTIFEKSLKLLHERAIILFALITIVSIINPLRIISIIKTLDMLASNNGWFIPWIDPLSQLGINSGAIFLGGHSSLYINLISYPISFVFISACFWSVIKNSKNKPEHLSILFGILLPILFLGIFLAIKGEHLDAIGGYKSYKITSTFSFFSLVALALYFSGKDLFGSIKYKLCWYLLVAFITISSIMSLYSIIKAHKNTIYIIPQSVIDLQEIENISEISGINIMDMGNFTNIWIDYFVMKKPHIFQKFPYGGRIVGEPKFPFTLISANDEALISAVKLKSIFKTIELPLDGDQQVPIKSKAFRLVNTDLAGGVVVTPGLGWWGAEPSHNWSGKDGRIAELIVDARASTYIKFLGTFAELRPNEKLDIFVDDLPVNVTLTKDSLESKDPIKLDPGRHKISVLTSLDPTGPFPHDGRTLGILWKSFIVEQIQSPR